MKPWLLLLPIILLLSISEVVSRKYDCDSYDDSGDSSYSNSNSDESSDSDESDDLQSDTEKHHHNHIHNHNHNHQNTHKPKSTKTTRKPHTHKPKPHTHKPKPHTHKPKPRTKPPKRHPPRPKVWICPAGWNKVSRTRGHWCIHVFAGTLNVTDARNQCKRYGAVLSGVENEQERNLIHSAGIKILRALNQNIRQGSVWIGAQRRAACRGAAKKNAAGCVPWAPNAFEWTDGFTTGKKMFRFRPAQPDYLRDAQAHVYMHIIDMLVGSAGATPGSLDDIQGSIKSSTVNLQYVRGYACGRRATLK